MQPRKILESIEQSPLSKSRPENVTLYTMQCSAQATRSKPNLTLPLFSDPSDELGDFRMFEQFGSRIEVFSQCFLIGNQAMDGFVAVPAGGHRDGHLLSREVLLKPTILVAFPRNQMMFGGGRF